MKKFILINFMVTLFTACLFVSCDEVVTDDKGVVRSIEATSSHNSFGKKYRVEVRIHNGKYNTFEYTLYTNKSYRVGDSIFIK